MSSDLKYFFGLFGIFMNYRKKNRGETRKMFCPTCHAKRRLRYSQPPEGYFGFSPFKYIKEESSDFLKNVYVIFFKPCIQLNEIADKLGACHELTEKRLAVVGALSAERFECGFIGKCQNRGIWV